MFFYFFIITAVFLRLFNFYECTEKIPLFTAVLYSFSQNTVYYKSLTRGNTAICGITVYTAVILWFYCSKNISTPNRSFLPLLPRYYAVTAFGGNFCHYRHRGNGFLPQLPQYCGCGKKTARRGAKPCRVRGTAPGAASCKSRGDPRSWDGAACFSGLHGVSHVSSPSRSASTVSSCMGGGGHMPHR